MKQRAQGLHLARRAPGRGRGQPFVDVGDGHRPLADGRGDPLDRARSARRRPRTRRARWSRTGTARARAATCRCLSARRPVSTWPLGCLTIASGSQAVCGRAPIRTKSAAASTRHRSPVSLSRSSSHSRRPLPPPSTTSVLTSTSTFDVASIVVAQVLRHVVGEASAPADDQRARGRPSAPGAAPPGRPSCRRRPRRRPRSRGRAPRPSRRRSRRRRPVSVVEPGDVEARCRRRRSRAARRARRPSGRGRRPRHTAASPSRSSRTSRLIAKLGAEHPRLLVGALGELGPGDPPREPEVVADQRARPGLAARSSRARPPASAAPPTTRRRPPRGRPGRRRRPPDRTPLRSTCSVLTPKAATISSLDGSRAAVAADDRAHGAGSARPFPARGSEAVRHAAAFAAGHGSGASATRPDPP